MTNLDIDTLRTWEGRSQKTSDQVGLTPVHALSATLDRDPGVIKEGDRLPPLWHWLYCRELALQNNLDTDGHQRRGDFLPPSPFPRRMWAGGRILFEGDILIGEPIERTSTIKHVAHKEGRRGPLLLVTIEHTITGATGKIVEEQDLVFLEQPKGPLDLRPSPAPEEPCDWSEQVTPSVAMLFRFSALTFNAHRIHYDRDYARDIEFYPDLVVHGPLTALLLADFADRNTDQRLSRFNFRAHRPMFVDRTMNLDGQKVDDGLKLRVLDDSGSITMTANATIT